MIRNWKLMRNADKYHEGQRWSNNDGKILIIESVVSGYRNEGTEMVYDFYVDIEGSKRWFSYFQLCHFIDS